MSEIRLNIKVALKVAEEHDTVLDRTVFSESSNETYGECAYQDKTTEFLQAMLDAPEGVEAESHTTSGSTPTKDIQAGVDPVDNMGPYRWWEPI